MVGSSWNSADRKGLAPIRSPAATKIEFFRSPRSCLTSVAIRSAPPAATAIFFDLSAGSSMWMPPGNGSR